MPHRSFGPAAGPTEPITFDYAGEKFTCRPRCPAAFVADLVSHSSYLGSTGAIIEFLGRLVDDSDGPAPTEDVVLDALRSVPPDATPEDRAAAITERLREAGLLDERSSRWEQATRRDVDVHDLSEIHEWVQGQYANRPTRPSAG